MSTETFPASAPLAGQNALITGASKGIGKAIALAFAAAGANVAVNYNSDREGAESVVTEIRAMGRRAIAIQADVARSEQVDALFEQTLGSLSPLTILVNNAGVQTWKSLLALREAEWDPVLDTNLKGCFLCTQRAARHMREHGGGSIINLGSGCNKVPFPMLVNYTASKGGIEMFTRSAAVELGKYGIRVNCAAPGAIEVERTKNDGGDYASLWAGVTPLARIGTPADVAQVAVFLASPQSGFVTGQTIWIDGGVFTKAVWPYE